MDKIKHEPLGPLSIRRCGPGWIAEDCLGEHYGDSLVSAKHLEIGLRSRYSVDIIIER